jgi:hypothetical protein
MSTTCECTVPLEECAGVPVFVTHSDLLTWLADRDITLDIDHQGRPSIPVAAARRLYAETAEANAIAERAAAEARAAHAAAVHQLRRDMAAAFSAASGGTATVDEAGRLTVPRVEANAINTGLAAARELWHAAPFEVQTECTTVEVYAREPGEREPVWTSYDLGVTLPRPVLDAALERSVRISNAVAKAAKS